MSLQKGGPPPCPGGVTEQRYTPELGKQLSRQLPVIQEIRLARCRCPLSLAYLLRLRGRGRPAGRQESPTVGIPTLERHTPLQANEVRQWRAQHGQGAPPPSHEHRDASSLRDFLQQHQKFRGSFDVVHIQMSLVSKFSFLLDLGLCGIVCLPSICSFMGKGRKRFLPTYPLGKLLSFPHY